MSTNDPAKTFPAEQTADVIQIETDLANEYWKAQNTITQPVDDWRPSPRERYTKYAVRGAGVLLALAAPAANGINTVAHETTHVPVHIAGADVTISMKPGSNVANVTALDQQFTTRSGLRIGRKDIGYDVNVDTSEITKVDPNFALNSETVGNILSQFTDMTAQKHEVMDAVRKHSREQFAIGAGEVVALELAAAGVFLYVRRRSHRFSADQDKRAAASEFMSDFKRPVAALAVAAAAMPIANLGYTYFSPNQPEAIVADPALAGTPLAGMEVNGAGKSIIDAAVPNVRAFIQNTDSYYTTAEKNMKLGFVEQYGTDSLAKQPGVYRLIFGDDMQGIPTGRFLGEAAQLYHADAIDAGGDATETGTIEETDTADTLADSAKRVPVIWVRGHHDDVNTEHIMHERKFIEANGKIQKVGPLSFYGVNDAEMIYGLGLPATPIKPGVDNATLTAKAIDYLCSDAVQKLAIKPIVISHDNAIGTPIAESGCVPTVLTGREYFPSAPIRYGDTTEIISGSTGGHGPNEGIHIFGTPKYPATFHEIDIDAKTNQVLSETLITVSNEPTADVTFGPTVKFKNIKEAANPNHYDAAGLDKSVHSSQRQYRHRGTAR